MCHVRSTAMDKVGITAVSAANRRVSGKLLETSINVPPPLPLPSNGGTTRTVFRMFTWKPKPESGRDCLVYAEFARQPEGVSHAPGDLHLGVSPSPKSTLRAAKWKYCGHPLPNPKQPPRVPALLPGVGSGDHQRSARSTSHQSRVPTGGFLDTSFEVPTAAIERRGNNLKV